MSSTTDVTKVSAASAAESILRRKKEKNIEVGLTAETGAGIAASIALQGVKKKPKKSLLQKASEAKAAKSAMLDDPTVPLSPELQKQYEKAKAHRTSISNYKKKRAFLKGIDQNRLKEDSSFWYDTEPNSPERAKQIKLDRQKDVLKMSHGVDAIGGPSSTLDRAARQELIDQYYKNEYYRKNRKFRVSTKRPRLSEDAMETAVKRTNTFVKEAKPDSIYKKDLSPYMRKKHHFAGGGYHGTSKKVIRENMVNRVLMQSMLGDSGTETYFYRKKPGSPVTTSQQLLSTIPDENILFPTPKILQDRELVIRNMYDNNILPRDMHPGNIGYDLVGRPKPLDLGHSKVRGYEKFIKSKEVKKALEAKNVMSNTNKRLYMKMAKRHAMKLPGILAALGIAAAPNPAEAAVDFGIDMASGGLLTPGELGKGTLPPEELAKRKTHNAKIRLQKLKEQQKLRQQKRMSNESNFRNLY